MRGNDEIRTLVRERYGAIVRELLCAGLVRVQPGNGA